MARKSVADLRQAESEEAEMIAEMKGELFSEVYKKQNKETRELIDKIIAQLRIYNRTKLDEPYLTHALSWLAMEVVKDLAITGIRLGTFTFPKGVCAVCGGEA